MTQNKHYPKILLVENEPAQADLLVTVFEEHTECDITNHARGKTEALGFLRKTLSEGAALPDLVLVSINDAEQIVELVRDIKGNPAFAMIPVIALIAFAEQEDIIRSSGSQPDHLLFKGPGLEDLIEIVNKICSIPEERLSGSAPLPTRLHFCKQCSAKLTG